MCKIGSGEIDARRRSRESLVELKPPKPYLEPMVAPTSRSHPKLRTVLKAPAHSRSIGSTVHRAAAIWRSQGQRVDSPMSRLKQLEDRGRFWGSARCRYCGEMFEKRRCSGHRLAANPRTHPPIRRLAALSGLVWVRDPASFCRIPYSAQRHPWGTSALKNERGGMRLRNRITSEQPALGGAGEVLLSGYLAPSARPSLAHQTRPLRISVSRLAKRRAAPHKSFAGSCPEKWGDLQGRIRQTRKRAARCRRTVPCHVSTQRRRATVWI